VAAAGAMGGLLIASTLLQQEALEYEKALEKQRRKEQRARLLPACLRPRVD